MSFVVVAVRDTLEIFYFPEKVNLFFSFQPTMPAMYSLPYAPRRIVATEQRLGRIYDAAKLGLKGDTLAIAAGMLPSEYRELCQLDPSAEQAAQQGKADAELGVSALLHQAAQGGDVKAQLAILQNVHGWVAKQAISIEVDQRISITGALAQAKARALEVLRDITDAEYENKKLDGTANNLLSAG